MSIISTGTLWASLSTTLNDSSEVSFGIAAFDAAVAHGAEELSEIDSTYLTIALERCATLAASHSIYIVSASAVPDSLSQFRSYGDYALGINTAADWRLPEDERGKSGFPPAVGSKCSTRAMT